MNIDFKELWEELKNFTSKKTLDALFPPVIFAIANGFFSIKIAGIFSVAIGFLILLNRLFKKEKYSYAFFGLIGVSFLAGLAYLTNNASNYYLGALVTSFLFAFLALISLILKKPIAALMSHLTRGFPMAWFQRKDILPAYRQVTLIWFILFTLRGLLQLNLYLKGSVGAIAFTNLVLGFPFTASILVISYVYGLYKLQKLKGPSVDEFVEGKTPPYKGQRKGF